VSYIKKPLKRHTTVFRATIKTVSVYSNLIFSVSAVLTCVVTKGCYHR